MEYVGDELLTTVKIQEVLCLQQNKALLSQLSAFQFILDDFYGSSRPSVSDYANRRDLIRIFNEMAKEIYGNNDGCPIVENFGSFLMDMFNAKSDLDLSINFRDQLFEADRIAKIKTLRKFAKKFYALRSKGHITTVELILSARVPVLKVTDSGSGIECDFSVGNRDGIAKSHIVLLISAIDERFQKLSFMLKAWAKAQDINSSKDGTLNSISLILLVAFHLQTRDIPILPPFSAIFRDGTDPAAVKKIIPRFLNYGKRNKESLAELFVSLLVKLESVETLWTRGLCVSTYEGSWVYKNWKAAGYMRIEDFIDRSENTARAVKSKHMKKIYSCIRLSVEQIRSFTEGIINADKLKILLFGNFPPQRAKVIPNFNTKLSKPISQSPTLKKKKRPTQGSPAEEQRPGKHGKHGRHPPSMETPTPPKAWKARKKSKKRALNNVTQRTHVDTLSYAAPHVPEGQPMSYSNQYVQGSGGFIPARTHVETLRHPALNYPPHQPISFSGYGGFRPHVETSRQASNFPAGPSFPVYNPPVHDLGRFLRDREGRLHVETPSYTESMSRLPPRANRAAGYGTEGTHADTIYHATPSYLTPSYTSAYRPSSAMPLHQHYIPTASYTNPAVQRSHDPRQCPAGLQRSHDPRNYILHAPSQFAADMRR